MQLTAAQQDSLLVLARVAVRNALVMEAPPPLPTDPALHQPAGCFVSLHEQRTHRLRGCVGRLDATMPLAEAVRSMARAVLEDPRFVEMPVTPEDLPRLEIDLSVLSPLIPIERPEDFDLLNDGIFVTFEERAGCFLPQVARETGWTREQLLDRLCSEKLGLPAMTWRHPLCKFEKFHTVQIGPEPFLSSGKGGLD